MEKICTALDQSNVEYRRGLSGGGNQLRQPYIKKYFSINPEAFLNTELVHFNSLYLGNFPDLEQEKIEQLTAIINKAVN